MIEEDFEQALRLLDRIANDTAAIFGPLVFVRRLCSGLKAALPPRIYRAGLTNRRVMRSLSPMA